MRSRRNEYDLAGFAVGIVEKSRVIDGRSIRPGDSLLGLASSGAHSNGYSLVRRILEREKPDAPLLDALMEPTRIYVKPVLALMESVPLKGLAHITGGGITGNVPRMLPEGTRAAIRKGSWSRPKLFDWLQQKGNVAEDEMHRVFNCGIGMVIAVAPGTCRPGDGRVARCGRNGLLDRDGGERPAGEPQAVIG
jgi:phosphoribosylformylglycinamidine cyclo-ligase